MVAAISEVTSKTNAYPMVWVKLEKFCSDRGEDRQAVLSRIRAGKWLEGKHTKMKDGRRYINVAEADRWVEEK